MLITHQSQDTFSRLANQTVPRHMVHRAALTEVFLVNGNQTDDKHFQCMTQLPRTNIYFNDIASDVPRYDLILLLEVFRQASIYTSHAFIGVPLDNKFLYLDSDTSIELSEYLKVQNFPASAIVDVHVVDEHRRRGILQGVTFNMTLLLDGLAVARHKQMRIRWMDEDVWARMREKALARLPYEFNSKALPGIPISPQAVGRSHPGNIVIGYNVLAESNELITELIIPFDNGTIFDHPLDHIPGTLLMEGFRQSALAAIGKSNAIHPGNLILQNCKVEFGQFGEFGSKTYCHMTNSNITFDPSRDKILCKDMKMKQNGSEIAIASLAFDLAKPN